MKFLSILSAILFMSMITGCNATDLAESIKEAEALAAASPTPTPSTDSTDDGSSSETNECSYEVSAQYSLHVNPTLDFTVHYSRSKEVVSASDCAGIETGEEKTASIPLIARRGTSLRIDDDLNSSALSISSLKLSEPIYSDCIDGERVKKELISGSLDTFSEEINLVIKITYSADSTCPQPANQSPKFSPPPSNNFH